jgi:hypothetical protein
MWIRQPVHRRYHVRWDVCDVCQYDHDRATRDREASGSSSSLSPLLEVIEICISAKKSVFDKKRRVSKTKVSFRIFAKLRTQFQFSDICILLLTHRACYVVRPRSTIELHYGHNIIIREWLGNSEWTNMSLLRKLLETFCVSPPIRHSQFERRVFSSLNSSITKARSLKCRRKSPTTCAINVMLCTSPNCNVCCTNEHTTTIHCWRLSGS